jgi:hypothetical protein
MPLLALPHSYLCLTPQIARDFKGDKKNKVGQKFHGFIAGQDSKK